MPVLKRVIMFFTAVLMTFILSTECYAEAKGSVLIDEHSGRVLFENNKDLRLPMASTTKIMTALIALEQPDIDDYFTVDSKAILVEGSAVGLKKGDKASLRALAEAMLLESGNDAANAAAVKVAGSVSEFAVLMNERAKEIGLLSTSFETPSGLDGENHYSTAYDMALLAREALKNNDFAEICSSKDRVTLFGNPPAEHYLYNHNRLLSTVEGAKGVKTGFTKKAGRCLVSAAERDGVSLICVTLNCYGDWNYHKGKYEEFFALLKSEELSSEKVMIPVSGSEKQVLCAEPEKAFASLFEGEKEKIEREIYAVPFLFAPVKKGTAVGKIKYYLDGNLIAEAKLLAAEDIDKKAEKESFWESLNLFKEK